MVGLSWLTSPGSPFSLNDIRARYPDRVQTGDLEDLFHLTRFDLDLDFGDLKWLTMKRFDTNLSQWVIILFFVSSGIHHMDDVIYGD